MDIAVLTSVIRFVNAAPLIAARATHYNPALYAVTLF